MKLIMMKGLPASGKSTKAAEIIAGGGEYYRINRDKIREMLHFGKWTNKREGVTIDSAEMIVGNLLAKGNNVIIDDTNLGERHEGIWRAMAENFGAKFEIMDMMDEVSVANCLIRNRAREESVPESVIESMAIQYGYVTTKNFVVVDIDGTVADCSHRLHHLKGDKKDWKAFFSEMDKDTPRNDVYDKAFRESYENNAEVMFVSARPEQYRAVTEKWLEDNNMGGHALLMRRNGDKRPDTDVKFDIYNRYLKQYNIIKVVDDRPAVIEMWREQGLEVEDVGNGKDF